MTLKEFKQAFEIAKSDKDLCNVSLDHLFGFGLKTFNPTSTTLDAVAATMRWQALSMNGEWDMEELNAIRECGRKKFLIID